MRSSQQFSITLPNEMADAMKAKVAGGEYATESESPVFSRHLQAVHYGNDEVCMSGKRYSEEYKAEAAKQVIEQGRPVREVATRLGISIHSLYAWVREQRKEPPVRQADASLAAENRRLQAELRRVIEERDILKKAAAYFAKG